MISPSPPKVDSSSFGENSVNLICAANLRWFSAFKFAFLWNQFWRKKSFPILDENHKGFWILKGRKQQHQKLQISQHQTSLFILLFSILRNGTMLKKFSLVAAAIAPAVTAFRSKKIVPFQAANQIMSVTKVRDSTWWISKHNPPIKLRLHRSDIPDFTAVVDSSSHPP